MEKIEEIGLERFREKVVGDLELLIRVENTEYGKRFRATLDVETDEETPRKRTIVSFTGELDGSTLMSVYKEHGLTDDQLKDVYAKCAKVYLEVYKK